MLEDCIFVVLVFVTQIEENFSLISCKLMFQEYYSNVTCATDSVLGVWWSDYRLWLTFVVQIVWISAALEATKISKNNFHFDSEMHQDTYLLCNEELEWNNSKILRRPWIMKRCSMQTFWFNDMTSMLRKFCYLQIEWWRQVTHQIGT